MIQFAEKYPNIKNVVTLPRHLLWSHFLVLIPLNDQKARDFYGKLSYRNLFGVRKLREQIEKKVLEAKLRKTLIEVRERIERKQLRK